MGCSVRVEKRSPWFNPGTFLSPPKETHAYQQPPSSLLPHLHSQAIIFTLYQFYSCVYSRNFLKVESYMFFVFGGLKTISITHSLNVTTIIYKFIDILTTMTERVNITFNQLHPLSCKI